MSSPHASLKLPVVLLLAAGAALAGALVARDVERGITGPLAIAADGDRVAVAAPGMLYRLDGSGHLQAADDSVIAIDARDAGLAWLGSDLLVSPAANGASLLRCDDKDCAPFSQDPYAPTGPVQVAAASPGKLWLAETDADRAHRFFEDGRRIDMPLSDLQRPGALWQDDSGLYVANTNSGELQRYELHKRGVARPDTIATFRASAGEFDPPVLPLRMLPATDGGFHVLLTNQARSRGALVAVSMDGEVTREQASTLVNPVSLAASDDDLLVVDEDRMQVLRINTDGDATVFGDDEFNAAISARQGQRALLRLLVPVLLLAATLLATVGGWLLLQRLLSEVDEPAQPVNTGADGIAWLVPDAKLAPRRALRAAVTLLPLAIFPALLAAHYHYAWAGQLWAVAVLVLATVPAWLAAARARIPDQLRIGLRDKQLVIEHAEYGLREYWLTQVDWSERELKPENGVLLPLQRDGIALFHLPTLRESLFPRLQPARRKD